MTAAPASPAEPRPRLGLHSPAFVERVGVPGVAAAILLLAIALTALLAPLIAPYPPNAGFDVGPYAPVSAEHLLGTDGQTRDVLSRLIWGARLSLAAAVLPALLALPAGLLIGIAAAEARGVVEETLMRIVDVWLSFPIVLLAIAIAGVVGGGFWTVVVAIAFALTPYFARVAYSVAQGLRSSDFVLAARAGGESRRQVILWELLPNVTPPLVVYATSLLGTVMIVASGLSFFGLGAAPPAADWGKMIDEGRAVLATDAKIALSAGALVVVVAVLFNLVGDGIRNLLDPHR
jgi:peptide/nickel transport system permease protein